MLLRGRPTHPVRPPPPVERGPVEGVEEEEEQREYAEEEEVGAAVVVPPLHAGSGLNMTPTKIWGVLPPPLVRLHFRQINSTGLG